MAGALLDQLGLCGGDVNGALVYGEGLLVLAMEGCTGSVCTGQRVFGGLIGEGRVLTYVALNRRDARRCRNCVIFKLAFLVTQRLT
jgi:hypothetical protein